MAKECNMAVDTIRKRYSRLLKEGIIAHEKVDFLPKISSHQVMAWFGVITHLSKEKEVIQFLETKPQVLQTYIEMGKYNVRCLVALKKMDEVIGFVDSLKKQPHIQDIEVMIWCKTKKLMHPENLEIDTHEGCIRKKRAKVHEKNNKPENAAPKDIKTAEKEREHFLPLNPELDEIDAEIIRTLSRKGRTPFIRIANKLGVSTKTVISRYKKIEEKFVTDSSISLNLKKLGYSGYVTYLIKVSAKNWIEEVIEQLTKIPNIIATLKILGTYDIDVLVPVLNQEKLMETYKKIIEISGIEKIEFQIGDDMMVWPPLNNNID
jgi:Lrp/AsnC family transcriptional regulator for asnA, asnC and gidA